MGVPINLIATIGLLITVFGDKDLDQAATQITVDNELGQLDAAEKSLTAGFRLDPPEPMLWLAKARLQQARNMPRLALASANCALAIWQDADVDFILYQEALALAEEISVQSN